MTIIIALISGGIGALVSGIFALINRQLDKKDAPIEARFQAIENKLEKAEKDSVRIQILLLISDYPEADAEILEAAHHYFADLKGDWYMTSIFNKWLAQRGLGSPEWFNPKKWVTS